MEYQHTPVLLKETLEFLNPKEGKVFVDCTLGRGGHIESLKLQNPKSKIYGIDQDQNALDAAKEHLAKFSDIEYIQDNFKNLKNIIQEPVDGFLFDLGVSSHQIDTAGRGFSIQKDGPLDMRMDQKQKLNAEKIVNTYSEKDLQRIFKEFGEERFSHRIAKSIMAARKTGKIDSTLKLKQIIEKAIPTWRKRESVTRIFQALRIGVNNELENLQSALAAAIDLLRPAGRIAVISYHSLEDRIVKQTFKQAKSKGILALLTKKPVQASAGEITSNPRARSAKLRAAEKT